MIQVEYHLRANNSSQQSISNHLACSMPVIRLGIHWTFSVASRDKTRISSPWSLRLPSGTWTTTLSRVDDIDFYQMTTDPMNRIGYQHGQPTLVERGSRDFTHSQLAESPQQCANSHIQHAVRCEGDIHLEKLGTQKRQNLIEDRFFIYCGGQLLQVQPVSSAS